MLQIYVQSIIIWTTIIYCTIKILKNSIKENGWKSETPSVKGRFSSLVIISAIPIIRILIFIILFIMAVKKKNDFDEWLNSRKD